MHKLPRRFQPKSSLVGRTASQVLAFFLASMLLAPAVDLPIFSESKQASYLYSGGIAYFESAPPTHFTLKDFTRTNENLEKKYGDESGSDNPRHVVIHLRVYVVPEFSDDQYGIQIVSDHPLSRAKLNEIEQFIGENMLGG